MSPPHSGGSQLSDQSGLSLKKSIWSVGLLFQSPHGTLMDTWELFWCLDTIRETFLLLSATPQSVSIWITRLKRFIFAVFRRIGISQSLLQYTAVRRWWECRMPDQTSNYSKPLSFLWLTSDFCLSVWNLPCPQRKFFLYPLTRKWCIPQSHATYSKQRIFSPWILLAFPLLHWFLNTYFCMFGHTIPEVDFSVNHLLSTPDTRI